MTIIGPSFGLTGYILDSDPSVPVRHFAILLCSAWARRESWTYIEAEKKV